MAEERLSTEQVMAAYSRIFSTQDGIIVLGDILSQLGFFANCPGQIKPECIAVANTILSRCGLLNSVSSEIYLSGISYAINLAIASERMPANEEENDV